MKADLNEKKTMIRCIGENEWIFYVEENIYASTNWKKNKGTQFGSNHLKVVRFEVCRFWCKGKLYMVSELKSQVQFSWATLEEGVGVSVYMFTNWK